MYVFSVSITDHRCCKFYVQGKGQLKLMLFSLKNIIKEGGGGEVDYLNPNFRESGLLQQQQPRLGR